MKHEEIWKHIDEKLSGLGITRNHIQTACEKAKLNPFKGAQWTREDRSRFSTELRKASKPLIVAANKADKEPATANIERIRAAGYKVVPNLRRGRAGPPPRLRGRAHKIHARRQGLHDTPPREAQPQPDQGTGESSGRRSSRCGAALGSRRR